MNTRCSVNCIVPPHILQKLLTSEDAKIREIALSTLLATTRLRAERNIVSRLGFLPSTTGTLRRTIFDCKHRRILEEAELVRGEDGSESEDSSVNDAFDGLGKTYEFYEQVFQRNSIDDQGMRLDGYVHFGRFYNNAFWNGRQMIFGDGDGRIFTDFTKSLDVIAHELTHGVTQFTADLEYHNQSGALNESISDVFGSLVKQYPNQTADQADWLIGAEIFTPGVEADALRSLKSPGRAYDSPILGKDPQPAHMDNFMQLPDTDEGDNGGVHINSGIPNHAFYLTAIGIGGEAWKAPGHIWYEALKASTPTTDFREFANRTFDAAGRLYGPGSNEQKCVSDAWDEVGIRLATMPSMPWPVGAHATAKSDGRADLIARIELLAKEVQVLKGQVSQIKAKSPRAVPV